MTSIRCLKCDNESPAHSQACRHCGAPFKGDQTAPIGPAVTGSATASVPSASAAVALEAETSYPSTLLAPQTLLQNRYRITQLLGQGGMGAVYLAVDTRFSSKTCVIKEMLDHFNDPEQRAQATESFHREADLLATLKHAGIPEVYDRFTEANRHYLVMEYINGVDLEQRLMDQAGPFSEREVISWCIQCCDVLSYLHHQKPPIIYRDMKPANIITTNWGKAYLVDFGIARFFNPVSRGTMIGTQGYAPPEQYRGQVEPRSDLYALGATMHYMLTGRDPQNEPPFSFPPVRALAPEVSEEMEMLILKALDPETENRFASADEMLGQLMLIGGDDLDVIRECPHCGEKSSITRQFCPHCKQYISKKAHVLNPKHNGSSVLVTDAAGKHQTKPHGKTDALGAEHRAPTAAHLALPTGKTEFPLVPLKPILLGLAGAALALGAVFGGIKALEARPGAQVSQGEALLAAHTPEKAEGVSAYRRGQYQAAIVALNKAVAAHPEDGEARIYLQNAYLQLNQVPLFKLALAGPYSGAFGSKGAAELQGAAFAQEQLNGANQQPRMLLVLADDRSSTEGAVDVGKQLGSAPDLAGVIGHLDSLSTRAALPLYTLSGLPVVSPTSTSMELTGLSPLFFRLSPDDATQGQALARYVTGALDASHIVVLQPAANPHSFGLAGSFTQQAEAAGARVVRSTFGAKPDWKALALAVKDEAPEAIFMAGTHFDAVAFAKAAKAVGVVAPIVGGDSLYLPELLAEGGEAVEGLICSTFYHPRLAEPLGKQFESEFQSKFGLEANSRAALTYEAVKLFGAAAQKVGPNREAIAQYLTSSGKQGFEGLSGRVRLTAKGGVRRPLFLMQARNGRFEPLTQVVL